MKTDPVHISSLQIENVKRVEAVKLQVSESGLTVIGGNNGQGKSSILDAICWVLGGDKFKPTSALRDGAEKLLIVARMSNGMIVERYGKNGSLRVTTKDGRMGGQQILKEFVSEFCLCLQDFMDLSEKEKAKALLEIIGSDISEIDALEKQKFDERTDIGRRAERARARADSLPFNAGAKKIDVGALVQEIKTAMESNGRIDSMRREFADLVDKHGTLELEIDELEQKLAAKRADAKSAMVKIEQSEAALGRMTPVDITALQSKLDSANSENVKADANQKKDEADTEARALERQRDELTVEIEELRQAKIEMLNSAKLPLPGLSIEDGCLTYDGKRWDCMSHSQQLRVATAIAHAMNPKMGFVLLDKLEAMDVPTLKEFGAYLKDRGLQAIATRVSVGDECSIIIEEGRVKS